MTRQAKHNGTSNKPASFLPIDIISDKAEKTQTTDDLIIKINNAEISVSHNTDFTLLRKTIDSLGGLA
jgi:hypothetical protein